jgi:hypothetical protein
MKGLRRHERARRRLMARPSRVRAPTAPLHSPTTESSLQRNGFRPFVPLALDVERVDASTSQVVPVGEYDNLDAVAQIEFGQDAGDVRLDGAFADIQPLSDLRVS